LLEEATPAESDPAGDTFTFEKGGTTATGGHGWADVWKKGAFAWEYKGPGRDLNAAYLQLKKYADMLENPPLLITSDMKRIEIHTNFTNTVKVMHSLEIGDLADPAKRQLLRAVFADPEKLRPGITRQQVTTEAAGTFSELAHHLRAKGYDAQRVAHFLNRIIFCMFAEDVGLLPNRIFSKLATASVAHPDTFEANARQLFGGMAKGGAVAFEVIDWFNGGLFDDDLTLPLDRAELKLVLKCAELDWSNIEPSIFGTLFERGLDPDKRSQQGAHYTDPATIMKIVGPVVLEPWISSWETEKVALNKQIDRAKKSVSDAAKQRYYAFLERLATFKVLDPACGSGNFLYMALRGLKDFEKRVILEAELLGLPVQFPRVGPEAVLGVEVNSYAAELARVTIWIGELQWMIENGFTWSKNPILKPLDQIECRDAILNDNGSEATWPTADVIVGNPPFLGDKKMLAELGDDYTNRLRDAYAARVPGGADLCCYWFEKARSMIDTGSVLRAGFVATNSIRGGKNRVVLDRIAASSKITNAWGDEGWINEGAAVRVSLVCFAQKDAETRRTLDGQPVDEIFADLSGSTASSQSSDFTRVSVLTENAGVCFEGIKKYGPFDIEGRVARGWLATGGNANGRPNADVLRPWLNAMDIVRRPSDTWVIDFGSMSVEEASCYELPFAHAALMVKPERAKDRNAKTREKWWLYERPRPILRRRLAGLRRYIATPVVAKHRIFVWRHIAELPSNLLDAIARDDDVTFGILHSRFHELWALRVCTWLGVGNDPRYTPTTTFETFPFPEGLGPNVNTQAYDAVPQASAIAAAAKHLAEMRDNWLSPPDLVTRKAESVAGYPDRLIPKSLDAEKQIAKRTLTNLYNEKPVWLEHAHRELDSAVSAAYGWDWPLADDEILQRLFDLNQRRALPLDVRPTPNVKTPKKPKS
jgi:type II restriction/modification system DNA methylase subunit YeeA